MGVYIHLQQKDDEDTDMKFFVSRQKYWGVDEEDGTVVEVAAGGINFANPDMMAIGWRSLGEGQEFTDPREAVECAIKVCEAWRHSGEVNAKVAMGSTGGNTLPFEPQDYDTLRQKAELLYEGLPKCDQCGDIIDDDDETYTNDMDEKFCSANCAEKRELDNTEPTMEESDDTDPDMCDKEEE